MGAALSLSGGGLELSEWLVQHYQTMRCAIQWEVTDRQGSARSVRRVTLALERRSHSVKGQVWSGPDSCLCSNKPDRHSVCHAVRQVPPGFSVQTRQRQAYKSTDRRRSAHLVRRLASASRGWRTLLCSSSLGLILLASASFAAAAASASLASLDGTVPLSCRYLAAVVRISLAPNPLPRAYPRRNAAIPMPRCLARNCKEF